MLESLESIECQRCDRRREHDRREGDCPVIPSGLMTRWGLRFHGLTPMATTCRHFVAGSTSCLDSLRRWIHFVTGFTSWLDCLCVARPPIRGGTVDSSQDCCLIHWSGGRDFEKFSLPANSRENHSKHSGKNSFCDQLAFRSHFRQTRRTMFVSFQDSK